MRETRSPAFIALAAAVLVLCATPAIAQSGPEEAPRFAAEVMAVPPPTGMMTGRVLMKDGLTGVMGAVVSFTSPVYGTVERVTTGRDGKFRARLPVGPYTLSIARRLDVYESATEYRVPGGERVEIDFLLLRDVERVPEPPAARSGRDVGPDPRRTEPQVVGTVIDMVRPADRALGRRWAEALGFLGSVLAVALAAH